MIDVEALKQKLGLVPLSFEGGFYRETHRSSRMLQLPDYPEEKAFSTAIYYLLTPETFSWMHRLRTPEIYHFYLGDPVELLLLFPNQTSERVILGPDLMNGQTVQKVVPEGVWQGSRVIKGGRFALMGTTMAPGFDLTDFEASAAEPLIQGWPGQDALIRALCR